MAEDILDIFYYKGCLAFGYDYYDEIKTVCERS